MATLYEQTMLKYAANLINCYIQHGESYAFKEALAELEYQVEQEAGSAEYVERHTEVELY